MDRETKRKRRAKSRTAIRVLKVGAAVLACLVYFLYSPDNYNIAKPLDLKDRPTFVTDLKLRLGGVERCYEALDRAGVMVERLPDEVKGRGCGFEDVANLKRSFISWGQGVTLKCPMLAGLALWERHTLQPVARELFGSEVDRVQHFGTYSCRNVNNDPGGRRSEHATANAVDIAGFVLVDGTKISVLADWGKSSAKSRFLERVYERACRHFDTTLGPDYNAQHRDHFHFDNGGHETCQ